MENKTVSPTSEQFWDLLAKSGLSSDRQIKTLRAKLPADVLASAALIARRLVADNILTHYQAKHLLRGAFRGLVLDSYEIRDFLGKGGMGSVYLAWDRKADRPCALKVLLPGKRTEKRSILRFEREIEVSGRLSHPNIAVAYDSGEAAGVPYLAMEYVPGLTLYRFVKRRGPAPIYWISKWLATAASALDHAHQAGVIHRDIKPSNIIVRPDGEAKLLDMGLARWFEDDHNEQRVVGKRRIVGSFDYISPEQAADSARADARSDIYSLGCVLYFLLTGAPPFHHVKESREKMQAHRQESPIPVEKKRPDVPPGYALMVERMLAKDPSERFQIALEVADILHYWEERLKPAGPADLSLFRPTEDDLDDEGTGSRTEASGEASTSRRKRGSS